MTNQKIFLVALAFLACTTTLRAEETPSASCEKRSFKDVKTVTAFSLTHRPQSKKILFDDIGCGLKWRDKQCSSGQGSFDSAALVYDSNTLEEITIDKATFVQSEAISSPMGFGLAAFADPAAADKFIAEKGSGKKLTYEEVLRLDWK